jgi:tRNA A-37 threonylcarbamoyl transferase component Bud32
VDSKRYPWRIVALAAISLIGNVYLGYYLLFGLAADGIGLAEQAGRVVVTDVDEHTAGASAGLQPGDQILNVNGQQIVRVVDWFAQRMNFRADQPTPIRVQRGAKILDVALIVHGSIWDQRNTTQRASTIIFLVYKLITLLIGLFVVFNRPRDFESRLGGWVLVVMAAVFEAFQWGLSATTRNLPMVLAMPVMLVYVSAAFRTPLLAAFFCLYPKRLFANRWLWAGFWAGPIVATVYALYLFARTVYDPKHLTALTPPWVLVVFGVQSLVYLAAVLVVLPVSYWKLESVTDRRRFRVLVFGALAAMMFYLPRVISTSLINLSPGFYEFFESPYVDIACAVGMLIFPMSFAYAILKQRLFDVRVIIRRGVQYALARHVLLAIPVLAIGLLLGTVVAQGSQPLFSVLKTHAGSYVAIVALAALASTQRQKWLSALDRKFFRDKYDAQELFREIVEDVRRAESVEEVAAQVVGRIAEALHTQGCGLLVRKPGENAYRIVAAAPPGSLSTDLPATNKLIPLVRMLECPVPITEAGTGWVGQQLPQVDKDFLQKAQIELLVPVVLKEGSTEALLVLGAKLSEEPYSREDTALLENVAGALELLLMRGNALQPGRAFEECPTCGTCYDTGTTRCKKESTALVLVATPRMLAGRYRLEKRLGHGGMGKVYSATDMSLNREVAVKMIRDEFFADRKAVEKFRQESQVTGSLSHPNVVTVYDFGVEAGQRVFLVMELLQGITLRQELRASKRLDAARTLELFEGICAGVEAAHARGLIHRDLKPENIFLSNKDGKELVKITDFGIAKSLPQTVDETRDTMTGVLVGTMKYMSPEQLRGRPPSPLWDLWALAVIAYEAICGCAPFVGEDSETLRIAILGIHFPPVTELWPDAPLRWQAFFEGAFAHDEELRAQSVAEFWRELRNCLENNVAS